MRNIKYIVQIFYPRQGAGQPGRACTNMYTHICTCMYIFSIEKICYLLTSNLFWIKTHWSLIDFGVYPRSGAVQPGRACTNMHLTVYLILIIPTAGGRAASTRSLPPTRTDSPDALLARARAKPAPVRRRTSQGKARQRRGHSNSTSAGEGIVLETLLKVEVHEKKKFSKNRNKSEI